MKSTGVLADRKVHFANQPVPAVLAGLDDQKVEKCGPMSPRAADPNRMIRSGSATSTTRLTISWTMASSGLRAFLCGP